MQIHTLRVLKGLALTGAVAAVSLAMVGCGDMLSYSRQAKADGLSEYNDGHYADATGSFRNAVRQNPTDPTSEYWLGMSCEKTQDYHEAIDAYKTCLILMPKKSDPSYSASLYANAFDHLANVIAVSDITEADINVVAQTALADKASEQYRLLGRILRYRGDADSALDDYRRSVRLDPANYAAQKELGIYLEKLAQNQEAADVLRSAYRINQNDQDVNDALRQIGMVPGPGLLAQSQLARPLITGDLPADLGISAPAAHTDAPTMDGPSPRD